MIKSSSVCNGAGTPDQRGEGICIIGIGSMGGFFREFSGGRGGFWNTPPPLAIPEYTPPLRV